MAVQYYLKHRCYTDGKERCEYQALGKIPTGKMQETENIKKLILNHIKMNFARDQLFTGLSTPPHPVRDIPLVPSLDMIAEIVEEIKALQIKVRGDGG